MRQGHRRVHRILRLVSAWRALTSFLSSHLIYILPSQVYGPPAMVSTSQSMNTPPSQPASYKSECLACRTHTPPHTNTITQNMHTHTSWTMGQQRWSLLPSQPTPNTLPHTPPPHTHTACHAAHTTIAYTHHRDNTHHRTYTWICLFAGQVYSMSEQIYKSLQEAVHLTCSSCKTQKRLSAALACALSNAEKLINLNHE